MTSRYAEWMYDWEHRLTSVDNNRVVRPLEWGAEWARDWPCRNGIPAGQMPADPETFFADYNQRIIAASDEFYSYRVPSDFRLERREVRVVVPESRGGGAHVGLELRQAEVRDPQVAAAVEEQVGRLHVAVDDAELVGVVQRLRRLHAEAGHRPEVLAAPRRPLRGPLQPGPGRTEERDVGG